MKRKRTVVTSRPALRAPAWPTSRAVRRARPAAAPAEEPATRPRAAAIPVDLSVDLAPGRPGRLLLAHPLLVAAGGAGYGVELMAAATTPPAAIVTRGTTLKPHPGAEPPRMAPVASALVSAIGSPNPGVARVLEQFGSRWAAWDVPVVLALCAEDTAGFGALARAVDAQPGVAALELHLGCRDLGGRRGGPGGDGSIDPDIAARRVAAGRAETELPVLVKLGALAPDAGQVAVAAVEAGADAICAIDGVPAIAIDLAGRRPALGREPGSLSGPAILPIAERVVAQVARAVRVPVVGIGGVATLDDVLALLMAGASAIGMATAVLADPTLPGRLALELEAWCRAEGVGPVREIVGVGLASSRGGRRDRRR